VLALTPVVLLGEFLVSQEFRIHSFRRNVTSPLRLLDPIPVSLVRVVVRARILLL